MLAEQTLGSVFGQLYKQKLEKRGVSIFTFIVTCNDCPSAQYRMGEVEESFFLGFFFSII